MKSILTRFGSGLNDTNTYLAINEFLYGGQPLFPIYTNPDLLAFFSLNGKHNRGNIKIAEDRIDEANLFVRGPDNIFQNHTKSTQFLQETAWHTRSQDNSPR
jgi:hypothetical protein